MKVYVVTIDVVCEDCNSWPGGYKLGGVFSSEEKANRFLETLPRGSYEYECDVEEFEVG